MSIAGAGGEVPERWMLHRRFALTATALLLVLALTGCTLWNQLVGQSWDQRTYANWLEASSGFRSSLAGFIPRDATDLTIRWLRDNSGTILTYRTKSALDRAVCHRGELVGHPALDAQWWPAREPADGMLCRSGWNVFVLHGVTFAWTSLSLDTPQDAHAAQRADPPR